MRTLILALVALLALPPAALAQRDWARAYEEGKEAFDRGNCSVAESKMLEARETGPPKQSRRHNWSSVVYKPFIPDYYLGICAAKQGQYQKAERYLQSALDQKLIVEGDRKEYALATSTLVQARDEIQKLAAATKVTPPKVDPPPVSTGGPTNTGTVATNQPGTNQPGNNQPGSQGTGTSGTVTASNPTGTGTNVAVTPPPIRTAPPIAPANTPPAWLADFNRSLEASRAALGQRRYAEAYASATGALGRAGDNPSQQQARQLQREIERARDGEALRIATQARQALQAKNVDGAAALLTTLETLDSAHSAIAEIRTGIRTYRGLLSVAEKVRSTEKAALRSFLSGNYQQSEAELEQALKEGVNSPRIYLFLASSRAARALLAKPAERPALVAEAKRAYALARPGIGALTADRRFISPAILKLIGES